MTPDHCEACGGDSYVIETIAIASTVKRRRKCRRCGARWNTFERRGHIVAKEPPEEIPPGLGVHPEKSA